MEKSLQGKEKWYSDKYGTEKKCPEKTNHWKRGVLASLGKRTKLSRKKGCENIQGGSAIE